MAIMARDAHDEGIPETKIAKDLGVDRMTVRKWLQAGVACAARALRWD